MKTPLFTKMLNPVLMALLFIMAGTFWSGKAEACGVTAGFKDSVVGTTVYFKNTSSISVKHFSYKWHFGDGKTSDLASPTHAYSTGSKTYMVCLLVYDSVNSCSDSTCTSVTTGSACSAKASFTYKNGTGGKISFSNGSSTTSGTFKSMWDFNDKTSSTDKNPTHTYKSNGYYHICLTVIDSLDSTCRASYCTYDSVVVSSCSAHFVYATTKLAVVLADSGSSAFYHKHSTVWSYGDGTPNGSGDYAYHTYSKAGTYSICVTVYDSTTACSAKYCNSITVSACNITSAFNYGNAGNTFYFKSSSTTSAHTRYKWYFGDGAIDSTTGSGVSHKYVATDTSVTVYLLIYDSTSGCTAYSYQTVKLCPTTANYTYKVSGLTVSFAASTANKSTTKYSWNFGDKTALSDSHAPSHSFASNGTYNVCLTATDTITGCTSTVCNNITVTNCSLKVSFTDSISGHTVYFHGGSNLTSKHYSIKWYYGDGTIDSTSGFNAHHTYASTDSGANVYLLVYDSSSKCTAYSNVNIKFGCAALSDYTYSINALTVTFTSDSKNHKGSTYVWDFNDKSDSRSANPTHTYKTGGTYNVCLTVTDSATGCSTTTCHSFTVSGCSLTASFTDSISGHTVFFHGSTNASAHRKIRWAFGDGTGDTSSNLNPYHSYSSSTGAVVVTISVYDSATGCISYAQDSIVLCTALSDYTYSVSGLSVSFKSDSKNSKGAKYVWDFGDKSDSRSANPTHTYSSNGGYTACLTVTDSITGCTTTTCHTFKVSGGCTLTAGLTDSVSGHTVYFYGTTNASSHRSIIWYYGDGSIDSSKSAGLHSSHTYASTLDTALAYMRIYDSATQCLAYVSVNIKFSKCNLVVSFTDSIDNLKVKFSAKTNGSTHSVVTWYYGDGTVDSTSGLSATHTYAKGTSSENVYVTVYDPATKCTAYYSSTVTLSHCIYGTVTTGKTAAYPANVYLIQFNSKDSSLTAVDSTMTDAKGDYEFCGLANGTYYTKAALTDSNTNYKYYIPTYHNDATKWKTAVKIVVNNANAGSVNISMKKGSNPGGAGFIGGKISAGANKTGDPEVGILVVLYDSVGNAVSYTYSNAAGYYSFAGIAFGTYEVWGEIPGKTCYPAVVTINDTSATDNTVDLSVNITSVTAALKPIATWNVVTAHVYPNPVSSKLNISLDMKYAEPVSIKIYDVTGKVISEMNTNINGGVQNMEIDASSLPSGLYFVRMEMVKNNTLMEAQFVKAR